MAADLNPVPAKERLAASRAALLLQLRGGPARAEASSTIAAESYGEPEEPRAPGFLSRLPMLALARNVGARWWHRHPANAVGQLARPLLDRYAREQPFKLVGIAAAVGALAVVTKPWRLLSATAVVAAILKTSNVADLVSSVMQNNAWGRNDR